MRLGRMIQLCRQRDRQPLRMQAHVLRVARIVDLAELYRERLRCATERDTAEMAPLVGAYRLILAVGQRDSRDAMTREDDQFPAAGRLFRGLSLLDFNRD